MGVDFSQAKGHSCDAVASWARYQTCCREASPSEHPGMWVLLQTYNEVTGVGTSENNRSGSTRVCPTLVGSSLQGVCDTSLEYIDSGSLEYSSCHPVDVCLSCTEPFKFLIVEVILSRTS